MLVLSRKEKQTILVGDDIEITICRVSGRRVSIGLSAPKDVDIRRGEIRQPGQNRRSRLRELCAVGVARDRQRQRTDGEDDAAAIVTEACDVALG